MRRFPDTLRWLGIGVAFLVACAVPIVGLWWLISSSERGGEGGGEARPWRQPPMTRAGEFLRVRDAGHFLPSGEKREDLLFIFWFRPTRLPEVGERMLLVSRLAPEGGERRLGFQLALIRSGNEIRPQVYWRPDQERGGWHLFSPFALQSGRWAVFALSIRAEQYLGLHGALYDGPPRRADGPPDILLLGGYDLGAGRHKPFQADLLLGPFRNNTFRGSFGPFGWFRGVKLFDERLVFFVRELVRAPAEFGDQFSPRDQILWSSDGVVDRSPHHHELVREGGGG